MQNFRPGEPPRSTVLSYTLKVSYQREIKTALEEHAPKRFSTVAAATAAAAAASVCSHSRWERRSWEIPSLRRIHPGRNCSANCSREQNGRADRSRNKPFDVPLTRLSSSAA